MIWDIALWVAAAGLVVIVALRMKGAGSNGPSGKDTKTGQPKTGGNLLTQSKALPVIMAAVLVLALIMKFQPGILGFGPNWTEDQLDELESFQEALNQYELATLTKGDGKPKTSDWESIRALLEASGSEMSYVSEEVLGEIHQELPYHVANEFLPGIRLGTYGLFHYLNTGKEGEFFPNDVIEASQDSLVEGRRLLADWNAWFDSNRVEITDRSQ